MQIPTPIRKHPPLAAALLAVVALSCSLLEKKVEEAGPEAQIVVGSASLARASASSPLVPRQKRRPRDSLSMGGASKVKIALGQAGVFVNENSSLKILPPVEADSCVLMAHTGEYYLSARGGQGVVCRFGDIIISIKDADAALTINESGRLAILFAINGQALIKRGKGAEARLSPCQAVVLDAAGMSEDEAAMSGRAAAIERLKGWVGEKAIERAVAQGQCKPESPLGAGSEPADTLVDKKPAKPVNQRASGKPKKGAPADTVTQAVKTPAAVVASSGVTIEQIVGPRQIYAEEDFTIKCTVAGSNAALVTGYVWRFKSASEEFEKETAAPQVTAQFEKLGESVITCEVMGAAGILASQQIKAKIVQGQVAISAGGPYAALLNKPIKLLGNAKSRSSKIAQFEWYFTHSGKPDFAFPDNIIVQHSFSKSGENKAVFAARLVDGTVVSDTATVNVRSLRPTANAGADIVSQPNRKVKLKGTGASPDGKIVKYEWDFDGDGIFDKVSETSGDAEHVFKDYASPVLRVTDTEGNTDLDTVRVIICPSDMVMVAKGKYCIDKYEWPNQRGAVPFTNVSWHEADNACESAGKRLCTPDEWKRSCRNGNDYKPADGHSYPYGADFDDSKCNTIGNPKSKNALMASGALGECAGALGVFDMSGNAAEWTSSYGASAQAFGGFYQSGEEESGCEASVTLDKDKKYLYAGFRCCK
ncbi:MAG: SUMF1/EgtB/PvdO family nonheme iron enzyme [Chitinispirillales bacterium]|nr:SUMF1/EgtB/PvdO family nonheme iron enzyme [Chitinispirillales bacterium]